MPNITDYTSPAKGLQPTETGIDARAMEGRRVGAFYTQAGETLKRAAQEKATAAGRFAEAVGEKARTAGRIAHGVEEAGDQGVAYENHRLISAGAPAAATLHDNLNSAWNAIASDPNTDPHNMGATVTNFREQLEPQLQQFRDSFLTEDAQKWADAQVRETRKHFYEKTTADTAKAAGDALWVRC